METHGHFDEKFAAVRDAFERNFSEKDDIGASFAITIEGEPVIDIWAGHRDARKRLDWEGGPRGWMLQRLFYESLGLVKPR